MPTHTVRPNGRERVFDPDELIVSKTDLKGHITYVNDAFLRVSAYAEEEILGRPHNVIRHPDMPSAIFSLLWETIAAGREMFAYVVNLASDGHHYWVFAHVTPTFNEHGSVIGYHSNRRLPNAAAVRQVQPVYEELRAIERRHSNKAEAVAASTARFGAFLEEQRLTYDEYVWSVNREAASK